jgi:stage II sporulation protein D
MRIKTWFTMMVITSLLVIGLGNILIQNSATPRAPELQKSIITPAPVAAAKVSVPLRLSQQNKISHIPLEEYVLGVVAAEMPKTFAVEAWKAQAIAARTYIIHKLKEAKKNPQKSFFVENSTDHQVYFDQTKLQRVWAHTGDSSSIQNLKRAVQQTKGLVITYQHKPIDAVYFSTSNGYTEDAAEYFGQSLPYLQSVKSPWDVNLSNRYKTLNRMNYSEWARKLNLKTANPKKVAQTMKILSRTSGNRVEQVKIGSRKLSGREIREKLGLRSSHFTWRLEKKEIVFTTFGYGHGVGMSQYGAQGMALKGYTAAEILKHYYTGVEIQQLDNVY